jgi:hypothetical protein
MHNNIKVNIPKKIISLTALNLILTTIIMGQTNKFPATGNAGIGTLTPLTALEINAAGTTVGGSTQLVALIRNTNYNSTQSSGETRLGFGFANHYAAAISAQKETVNTTGFRFYTEYGYNTPLLALSINAIGNIGIGNSAPPGKLSVSSNTAAANGFSEITIDNLGAGNFNGSSIRNIYTQSSPSALNPRLAFLVQNNGTNTYANMVERMTILGNGNVLIGKSTQANNTYMLDVNGIIRSNQVVVNTNGADYVFDHSYKLATLSQVEDFINSYHHLPEIASAEEMQKNGISLGENQILLLKKIEELTLYLIDQHKKQVAQQELIDQQAKLLDDQQAVLKDMAATLAKLRNHQ